MANRRCNNCLALLAVFLLLFCIIVFAQPDSGSRGFSSQKKPSGFFGFDASKAFPSASSWSTGKKPAPVSPAEQEYADRLDKAIEKMEKFNIAMVKGNIFLLGKRLESQLEKQNKIDAVTAKKFFGELTELSSLEKRSVKQSIVDADSLGNRFPKLLSPLTIKTLDNYFAQNDPQLSSLREIRLVDMLREAEAHVRKNNRVDKELSNQIIKQIQAAGFSSEKGLLEKAKKLLELQREFPLAFEKVFESKQTAPSDKEEKGKEQEKKEKKEEAKEKELSKCDSILGCLGEITSDTGTSFNVPEEEKFGEQIVEEETESEEKVSDNGTETTGSTSAKKAQQNPEPVTETQSTISTEKKF